MSYLAKSCSTQIQHEIKSVIKVFKHFLYLELQSLRLIHVTNHFSFSSFHHLVFYLLVINAVFRFRLFSELFFIPSGVIALLSDTNIVHFSDAFIDELVSRGQPGT